MYNLVYETMAQVGVAKKLLVKQWQNMRGESASVKDAVGEKWNMRSLILTTYCMWMKLETTLVREMMGAKEDRSS